MAKGTDTTESDYWLNWRFLLCAIWLLGAMVLAALLIWRYEWRNRSKVHPMEDVEEEKPPGRLYQHQVWGTCSEKINPLWLLAFRIVSFLVLLGHVIYEIGTDFDGDNYLYYTEWTFGLVTIYFGLASALSIHGYLHSRGDKKPGKCTNVDLRSCRTLASGWGYTMQIIFQVCGGAVVMTDLVFWAVILPQSPPNSLDYSAGMLHSINLVFLLGDAIINDLRFPFFRVAYVLLWTSVFIIFQWIVHAVAHIEWPYEFLELSESFAPALYLVFGIAQVPFFGIFALIFRIKKWVLSR